MVLGNATIASLGDLKLKAEVRSPETARRHFVILPSVMPGYWEPKRRSINRIREV